MNSTREKRLAALIAGIFLLIGAAAPARSADCSSGRSARGPRTTTSGYDRSFIKEWQANPPKGYPTLSKANLAADQGRGRAL